MKKTSNKRVKTITANTFMAPIFLFVVVMHVIIITVIIGMNNASDKLSSLMHRSSLYQQDATNIQASTTLMSETTNNFVLRPINEDSSLNIGPMYSYANEVNSSRRESEVLARFKNYKVSSDVITYVNNAANYSESMYEVQIHAISLVRSVYTFPDNPILNSIERVALTDAELAMSNGERLDAAKNLILNSEYAQSRYFISENITACNNAIQRDFETARINTKHRVVVMRNSLWVSVAVIILYLLSAFIFFFRLIIKPLRKYTKDISENRSIEQLSTLEEMHQLVNAFNELWNNRNKAEQVLRLAAENDSLTGLPNRYCLERDLINTNSSDSSIAVLVFDVNFLKQTNDEKGHLEGDKLLRSSASCICECFALGTSANCYRLGGDEFVAVLNGCDEKEIIDRIEMFNRALVRENISVSVGYAYSNSTDASSIKDLLEKADQNMYKNKRNFHEELSNSTAEAKNL